MIYALIPLILILSCILSFVLYLVFTEYKPEDIEEAMKLRNEIDSDLEDIKTITTFNMGYCSLDKNQDFFLEGGKNRKKISRNEVFDNLNGLTTIIKKLESDFYFLQEVDTQGSRSSNINQVEHIFKENPNYNMFYAYNYRVKWVPYPLFSPLGSAYSGLLTMSKKQFLSSTRHSLEGQETFPKSLFFLKRCMTVNRIQTNKSKNLYLINIHFSAYDKAGQYRSKQIAHVLRFIKKLYNPKENYIIVGGDFNLLLDKNAFEENMPEWVGILPQSVYESDFEVIYDSKVNTVRSEDRPYKKGINFETVIDGFIVSPNIGISKVETHDYGFEYTDHNPVTLSFKLE